MDQTARRLANEIGVVVSRMEMEFVTLNRMWEALRDHCDGKPIPKFEELMKPGKFSEHSSIREVGTVVGRTNGSIPNTQSLPRAEEDDTDWSQVDDLKLWPRIELVKEAHRLGCTEGDTRGKGVQHLRELVETRREVTAAASRKPPVLKKPVLSPPGQLKLAPKLKVAPFKLARPRLGS